MFSIFRSSLGLVVLLSTFAVKTLGQDSVFQDYSTAISQALESSQDARWSELAPRTASGRFLAPKTRKSGASDIHRRKLISGLSGLAGSEIDKCSWDGAFCSVSSLELSLLYSTSNVTNSLATAQVDELECSVLSNITNCNADSRCTVQFVDNSLYYCASLSLPRAYSTCYQGFLGASLYCGAYGNSTSCNVDAQCGWNPDTQICEAGITSSSFNSPASLFKSSAPNATANSTFYSYIKALTNAPPTAKVACPKGVPSNLCTLLTTTSNILPNATKCEVLTASQCAQYPNSCSPGPPCALNLPNAERYINETILPLLAIYQDPIRANITTEGIVCNRISTRSLCISAPLCIWSGVQCSLDRSKLDIPLLKESVVTSANTTAVCRYHADLSNCQNSEDQKACQAFPYCEWIDTGDYFSYCDVTSSDQVQKVFSTSIANPAAALVLNLIKSCQNQTTETKCLTI